MHNWIRHELEEIDAGGLRRSLRTVSSPQGPRIVLDGREVVNLCSNDYLGLAAHPALKEAAVSAVRTYGCGSGSSRLISGNCALYGELESLVASFVRREKALVFNSGYAANTGILPVLAGRDGVIYSDELNHASIIDGARLSRARTRVWEHGSLDDLERLVSEDGPGERRVVVTESVFSMDGDAAPLPGLCALAAGKGLMLVVDEAHAIGVAGPEGRGLACGLGGDGNTVLVGTFGKALGSAGAFVAGSADLIDFLINRARSFIFTTALPPAALAAGIAAIKLLEADDGPRERLHENIAYFTSGLRSLGFTPAARARRSSPS